MEHSKEGHGSCHARGWSEIWWFGCSVRQGWLTSEQRCRELVFQVFGKAGGECVPFGRSLFQEFLDSRRVTCRRLAERARAQTDHGTVPGRQGPGEGLNGA